jgi:hypothetical protein
MSCNRYSRVFPCEKAYEGVSHSSASLGATPSERTLRQSKDPPTNPFWIARGLGGYYRVPIVEYLNKGN